MLLLLGLLFVFGAGAHAESRAAGGSVHGAVATPAPGTAPLISEQFNSTATTPNAWAAFGDACLTAGGITTPITSVPACGSSAPADAPGAGALQLTTNAAQQLGAVVLKTPISVGNGFQVTFTDAAFNAPSGTGADGLSLFLADASQPLPTPAGTAGLLGYVGVAGGYVGVGFDEYGNFSVATANGSTLPDSPGLVPDTVAVRGAYSAGNPYLGGYTGTTGAAQSLPFGLSSPVSLTRPALPPRIRVTLTATGLLSVEIDPRDGYGYRLAYNARLPGNSAEPALPKAVYLGFAGATGGDAQVHQIYGVTVTPLGHASATPAPASSASPAPGASPLLSEAFDTTATSPNLWSAFGGACLTAGGSATPGTSIPACGSAAPIDLPGSGALQLTPNIPGQFGAVFSKVALPTSRGFQVVFTDAAFDAADGVPADGLSLILSDASLAFPAPAPPARGGYLGYVGLAGGYLGVGFDDYGNFSSSDGNGGTILGFPGTVPNTVAIRGAFSSANPYLGGYTGTTGVAQSLPFPLDAPAATQRPTNPPTVRVTVTAAGFLSVEIDPHDGNGYRLAYGKTVAGAGTEPPLPPQVYLGFASSTGGFSQVHQIYGLSVTPLAPLPMSFVPSQIPNLAAWYDASDPSTLAQTAGRVSSWLDKSGHANTLVQSLTAAMPLAGQTIGGLAALDFSGTQFLASDRTTLSRDLFNDSTVFVVTSAATTTQPGSVLSSGRPPDAAEPLWQLRPFDGGFPRFTFNNAPHGVLAGPQSYTGPAVWSAGGSATGEFFHKNGDRIATSHGPQSVAAGDYPLVVGGNLTSKGTAVDAYLGTVGEILIYHRYLTTAESQTVEGYLACKWGLQNRLPENHPYRATCPGAAAATPVPTAAPVAGAVPVIPELRSANGRLALTVVARQAASGAPELTYNGSPVLPTLRVLPGDIVSVTLTNSLPAVAPGTGYVNDTNLHFHGLHVSPNAPGDDSIDMLALPGQTLHYEFSIPVDHPPGLYWYHSHAHGEVERQNLSGMSGALIVDGIANYLPGLSDFPERVLVVRDALLPGQNLPDGNRKQIYAMGWAMSRSGYHGSMRAVAVRSNDSRRSANPYVTVDPNFRRITRRPATGDGHCTGTESPVKGWTVNGVPQPSIGIRPGETQFWRVVNAGSDTYLDLSVDNTTMTILELDGVPLTSGVGTSQGIKVSDYVVPPASRIEFVVVGPRAGTTSYLRTLCFDAGAAGPPMPAAILATLDPAHSLSDQARPRPQRLAPKLVTYRFPLRAPRRAAPHAFTRRARFTAIPVARAQTIYYSDQNTINGQAYDPGAAPQLYAQSGTVEEWTIVNTSSQVHTFHIHQIHFLLEAVNGVTQAQQYVMDNVNVPAASASGPGTVKLLLDFTDPRIVGTFLLHCHILAHEDAGMMAKIRVGTGPPLSADAASLTFASPASAAQIATVAGGTAPYALSGCTGVATGTIAANVLTVTPTGTGSCFFTISDATGLTFQLAVNVGTGPSAVSVTPNVLSFAAPGAAAQNATVAGGTPPYTASGCAGIATAAINGTENGVTVKPVAAGACTLTVADSASRPATLAISVNAPSTGGPADNITFHHDASRTGWYSAETTLTTANVAGGSFGLLATLSGSDGASAFGKVYAQPLYVQNEATSDGETHNLVIVATATDRVYAFDEATHAVVWEANFTNAGAGIRQQLSTDMGCDDVNPNVGITGTPVIDRARDRLYVVVPTYENGTFHLRLHALALKSGADAVSPVEVAATVALATGGVASVSAVNNFNRSALLEADGNVYVPLGSHCDFGSNSTHGWVLAFSAANLAPSGSALDVTGANTGTTYFLGALWGSGFGPDADATGNVYFATGNGPYNGSTDFGMSVVRVPGDLDLTKASTFTPYGELGDSAADADLGAGGVVLLPAVAGAHPRLLVAGGKCGAGSASGGTTGCQKYLLDRDALGGVSAGDAGALWHADTAGGMWGGPATFQDAKGVTYVVYGGGSPLSTYALGLAPLGLTVQSSANVGCLECRDRGSQPVVSSNGTLAGTAVVWALQTPGGSGGTISLYAFDALDMSHTLFSGAAGNWTVGAGASYIGGALVSPVVANGRVYVPTDGGVGVFGLKQ
jgi:FtsP/CotA-like multicopper oxidase with cupredoxin domain